jgi:hypothetical protein
MVVAGDDGIALLSSFSCSPLVPASTLCVRPHSSTRRGARIEVSCSRSRSCGLFLLSFWLFSCLGVAFCGFRHPFVFVFVSGGHDGVGVGLHRFRGVHSPGST